MPEHVAAAAMKKIGRFERFASAFAVSHVVYHMMPASPIGWGLAPMSVGRVPCAKAAVAASAKIEKEDISFIPEQTRGVENGFAFFEKASFTAIFFATGILKSPAFLSSTRC